MAQKTQDVFRCVYCNFMTKNKRDMNRHIESRIHILEEMVCNLKEELFQEQQKNRAQKTPEHTKLTVEYSLRDDKTSIPFSITNASTSEVFLEIKEIELGHSIVRITTVL